MSDTYTILGAGVAGLCVALELSRRGATVQIHDPNGLPGQHSCSWWAGGMLAPWCEFENAEDPVLRLGQKAFSWWDSITQVTRSGTLVVAHARDLPDLRRFSRRTTGYSWADAQEIRQLEPDLTAYTQALFFEKEAHLAPRQALQDLVSCLRQRDVPILSKRPDRMGRIIDCTGFAARQILSDLRGVRGEMLVLRAPDVCLSRPVRLLHPRIPLYVVPRGEGIYMLGATMIESEHRGNISARSMLELLSAAYALNPAFGEAEILETGVDLRPAFPDNLPRVRQKDGIVYANGLFRHGFLLAPALAQSVADLLLDDTRTELADADFA